MINTKTNRCATRSNTPRRMMMTGALVGALVGFAGWPSTASAQAGQIDDKITPETPGSTTTHYAGIWADGPGGGDTWQSALTQAELEADREGQVLVDFEIVPGATAEATRYAGVWRAAHGTHHLVLGSNPTHFLMVVSQHRGWGNQLLDLESWVHDGQRRYGGLFAPRVGQGQQRVELGLREAAFLDRMATLAAEGFRLIDVESWPVGSVRHYAGVWQEGEGEQRLEVGLNCYEFRQRLGSRDHHPLASLPSPCDNLASPPPDEHLAPLRNRRAGPNTPMRLLDIEVYRTEEDWHIMALWQEGNDPEWVLLGASAGQLTARHEMLNTDPEHAQRRQLIDLEVHQTTMQGLGSHGSPWHDGGSSVPPPGG